MPSQEKRSMSVRNVYIGIDPGASGGVAVYRPRGEIVELHRLSEITSDKELFYLFQTIIEHHVKTGYGINAVIEKVGGFIHGRPMPGSAMFNFGMGYGKLLMALTGNGISFEEVQPQKWQKALCIPKRTKVETSSKFKNRLLAKAHQLHPRVPLWQQPKTKGQQLEVCDSLLIATYCHRRHTGTL